MEEPPPITIKNPSKSKIMITGASQNFLRSFINIHKSFSKSIFINNYIVNSHPGPDPGSHSKLKSRLRIKSAMT